MTGPIVEITRMSTLMERLITHCTEEGQLHASTLEKLLTEDQISTSQHNTENGSSLIIHTSEGRHISAQTPSQARFFEETEKKDLVFVVGPSGTGKTFLAVAIALRALRRKRVNKIIITRPAVEAGESLGFLPGDLKEKMEPYLQPIYDSLREILSKEKLAFFLEKGVIDIVPLAYMRGRTLPHAFVLIDEAQNATATQLKMLLTRIGHHSRMIVTGDLSQIDLPTHKPSGLQEAITRLQKLEGIGYAQLAEEDIMRHPLVKQIILAYGSSDTK